MSALDYLGRQISLLKDMIERAPSLRWATVVTASPLQIRLDGDMMPLGGAITLTVGLRAGDRVAVLIVNRRAIIIGNIGGNATPLIPTDNKLVVNGREYVASGVFASVPPVGQTADYPPVYCGHIDFPTPYAPPPGYGFTVHVLGTSGYPAGLEVYDQNSTRIRTRVMQVGSKNLTALHRVGWRLVKTV